MIRRSVLLLLPLAGCAGAQVAETRLGTPAGLARPRHVVVADFAVSPDQVHLDSSIRAMLERSFAAAPPGEAQLRAGRAVGAAIADGAAAG
uniref:hypothetical protein n=1 Tax=Falsiroseomonas oryzae TaxID=2766473 RepID=UPI0022EA806A